MTENEPESKKAKAATRTNGLVLGVSVGVALGVALDNFVLGIAIGVAIGAAFSQIPAAAGKDDASRK